MDKKRFSTGIPKLDQHVGGILPGDSLLAFVSDPLDASDLVRSLLMHAAAENIPLYYFSLDGSYSSFMANNPKAESFRYEGGKSASGNILARIKRHAALVKGRSYLILEDLSKWKKHLSTDKGVTDLLAYMAELAAKKKSFLIATAVKGEFKGDALAGFKDCASLCLDFIRNQDELYLVPLSLKGRYVSPGILPFRCDLQGRKARLESPGKLDSMLESVRESYQLLFQEAGDPMVIFDINGDRREFNRRSSEILGYEEGELKLLKPTSFLVPEEKIKFLRFLLELRRKKKGTAVLDLLRKDGRPLHMELLASNVGGGLFLCAGRDISERLKAESYLRQKEAEYRSMLDAIPLAVAVALGERIIFANRAFLGLFGHDKDGPAELNVRELFAPESRGEFRKKTRAPGETPPFDAECQRRDGSRFSSSVAFSRISYGSKDCLQISFLDISAQKEYTEKLAESEKRYRLAVESSPYPLAMLREGNCIYANRAFFDLFAVEKPENLIGTDISLIASGGERQRLALALKKRTSGKQAPASSEFVGIGAGGKKINFELTLVPVPGGASGGEMLAFCRDRTLDKINEESLRQHLREMHLLREVIPSLESTLDLHKLAHSALFKIMDVMSWEMGALFLTDEKSGSLNLTTTRNMPQGVTEKLASLNTSEGIGGFLSKTLLPHLFSMESYPSYLAFRSLFREVGMKGICFIPLISGNEKLAGIIILGSKSGSLLSAYSEDLLTAIGVSLGRSVYNAKVYNQLKENEKRFRELIESSSDTLYTASPSGSFQYVSPSIHGLSGYSQKEFYRNPSLWLSIVHPEDKKILLERTAHLGETNRGILTEYRILPRGKASYRWIRDHINIPGDARGGVGGVLGTIVDITEEKQLLEGLSGHNALSSSIFASIQEGVAVYDRHLKCIKWNNAMEKVTGLKEREVLGKYASETLPGYSQAVEQLLARALSAGEVSGSEEIRYTAGGGTQEVYLRARYFPMRGEREEITGVIGIITDVSKSKFLEHEMQQSEQILTNVIDAMGDILTITDLEGTVVQVNKAFLRILGYSRADAVGCEFPYPWVLEGEMGRFVVWIANLRERTWLHDFDMTWKAQDGRLIPMSLSTTLLRNSMGEPIAMLNIARDITERKKLVRDLENRNRQIEMINRIISKANETLDFEEIFSLIAKEINGIIPSDIINVGLLARDCKTLSVYAAYGKQPTKKGDIYPIEKTLTHRVLQERKPIVVSDILAEAPQDDLVSKAKGLRSQITLPILMKGNIIGSLVIGSREPHSYSEEHAAMIEPIAHEIGAIIDRVQLFRQVTDDSSYIHNLLNSLEKIVYTVDTGLRIREVNRAWHELMRAFGAPAAQDFHGLHLFDVLPVDSLKILYQNVVRGLLSGKISHFSEEIVFQVPRRGLRTHQLTINPMVIDKKITGLVFTHTDITALKNTQAELKRSNEQLLALNEIAALVNTSLDLGKMLVGAIPLLKKTIGASAVIVYLREGGGDNDLVLAGQMGFGESDLAEIGRLQTAGSATGDVISRKQAMYIREKAYEDLRILKENRERLKRLHLEAMALIPLTSKETVLGALDIFYDSPHDFTEYETQVLSLVGSQLGTAIENARLYGELYSQIDRLSVLYELSQELTSTLNVDQIFRAVYAHVSRVMPYRSLRIDLYNETLGTKTPVFGVELEGNRETFIPMPGQPSLVAPESPEQDVLEARHSLRSADRASMFIPMLSKEAIIGIMALEAEPGSTYTENHLRLLESIGNLTAIALEKGKLYEETLQKSAEIQRRNKELDDFTYVVSHDLKEPLISVEGFSKILQADYNEIIQAEGRDYLDSIVGATTRMKGLIDDLLMLSRVSRPSESFKNIPLGMILREIVTDMEFTVKRRGVRLQIPDEIPQVYGNETQLKILFRNLISNAIKFNNSPAPAVEIAFQNAENNYYLFSVRDNGIGIDREFHEKIFVIFQRLHRREEYEGSGAGLAIVKKIVEKHDGRIWVESEPGKGSTFYFTIPKPLTLEQ